MIERRAKIGTATPAWFQRLNDPFIIQNAVGRGGVHFPGDQRMHIDRLNSYIGHVSSRTRQKCQLPDELGLSQPIRRPDYNPQYDAEGYITTVGKVLSMRWDRSQSNIECLISRRGFTWVPLSLISPRECDSEVYQYLDAVIKNREMAKEYQLQWMTERPSPDDVMRVINQAGHHDAKATPGYSELNRLQQKKLIDRAQRRIHQWSFIKDQWDEQCQSLARDVKSQQWSDARDARNEKATAS